MKIVRILLLFSTVALVTACGSDNNDDEDPVAETPTPTFNAFARDVFSQQENSEPKAVELGVTFKVTDNTEDFSDLIN